MKPTLPPHHLRAREYGSGAPLIILHGLFGSWENWHPVAKALSLRFTVHVVDQRNHGGSFHSSRLDYDAMAEDIRAVFPQAQLRTLPAAGHWAHVDDPAGFARTVTCFMEAPDPGIFLLTNRPTS